jgi:site-specific DNA recombinase
MTNSSTLKYVMYARRSIEKRDCEENVVSIESQLSELRKLAEKKNLKIVCELSETKSAKTPYIREKFQEMIKLIESGKADAILCWKMDRLARNPVDEGTIKYLLQNEVIKNIKSIDRDWYPDDNVLLASVEFGVATQYLRDLAKHIKRGMNACAERGYRPCSAPLGYKNSKYNKDGIQEEILVDDERFYKLRKLFDMMLTGKFSVMDLVEYSNKNLYLGSRFTNRNKISKTNLYGIFTNTFYYGEFEYPKNSGNWHKGNHIPMITTDEYDKIQLILGRHSKPRPKKHKFPFTGDLIKCHKCNSSITAEHKIKKQKNGNIHHYTYYHCTGRSHSKCKEPSISAEALEKEMIKIIDSLELDKKFQDWTFSVLKKIYKEKNKNIEKEVRKKNLELENVENKLAGLLELRISNEITPEEFKSNKHKLESVSTHLRKEIENIKKNDEWFEKMKESANFLIDLKKKFINGTNDEKRKIISLLCYNLTLKDKTLLFKVSEPFRTINNIKKPK